MSFWEVLAVAVALGCDAFAVGLGVGTTHCRPRQMFRLAFHFGFFQFAMPLIGWGAGWALADLTRTYAPWLAFAVLVFLGGRMIYESLRPSEECPAPSDPTKGWSLVALSVATSIDALGVGFSLGVMGGAILWPSLVIGLIAALMTLGAMRLGRRLSSRLGGRAGMVGGVILLVIAVKLVAF